MRTWKQAERDYLCGGCGKPIANGAALQITELPNVKRVGYRGECCAGHAPPNLPAAPVFAPMTPSGMVRAAQLQPLRTRGALKAMAHGHLPASESESALPASLPRTAVRDLRVDRQSPLAFRLPHPND